MSTLQASPDTADSAFTSNIVLRIVCPARIYVIGITLSDKHNHAVMVQT